MKSRNVNEYPVNVSDDFEFTCKNIEKQSLTVYFQYAFRVQWHDVAE